MSNRKRIRIKIGDIFEVPLIENNTKRYFQFIAKDELQLEANVIRIFKKCYMIDEDLDISEILSSGIDFYANVIIQVGYNLEAWNKVGNCNIGDKVEIPFFRDSTDYGKPGITISSEWRIWQPTDDEFTYVGVLDETQKKYDIGIIVRSQDIITKMTAGNYDFFYPEHK